jgi:DNA-binding NarL/FixJ family response regulator
MKGGTLVVSRVEIMFPHYLKRFKELGFGDVVITSKSKDALNTVIYEMKPGQVFLSSGFYEIGTPYMAGELLRLFPKLNIAVVSLHDYPLSIAPWFIWHGVKSYLSVRDEGYDVFHAGLQDVRKGKPHIASKVERIIEHCGEWPDTSNKITKRQMECLIMLCCGYIPKTIGERLHIGRTTVNRTLANLYDTFHVKSREEMVALAWQLEMVTPKDIKFYDDRNGCDISSYASEWADVKKKCDTFIKKNEELKGW